MCVCVLSSIWLGLKQTRCGMPFSLCVCQRSYATRRRRHEAVPHFYANDEGGVLCCCSINTAVVKHACLLCVDIHYTPITDPRGPQQHPCRATRLRQCRGQLTGNTKSPNSSLCTATRHTCANTLAAGGCCRLTHIFSTIVSPFGELTQWTHRFKRF